VQLAQRSLHPSFVNSLTHGNHRTPVSSVSSCSSRKRSQKNQVCRSLYLVDILNSVLPKGRRRGPKDKRPLLRPIICICNDGHASSLAKLRLHCLHIRITRPADNHVVKRLQEICEVENLKTCSRALSTLVGVAKGDLRGCLNTLQVRFGLSSTELSL
jgi:hypothetical protein